MRKLVFYILSSILWLVSQSAFSQFTATTSIGAAQENWNTAGAWSFPVGFTPFEGFPQNDFDEDATTAAYGGDYGQFIIVDTNDNIKIPNNVTIDLRNSGIIRITLKTGSELHFGSNAKLLLPSGAEIVFESGAELIADNNSIGSLVEIGGNGVWGRACSGCNNSTLTGPGTINENSTPGNPLPIELLHFKASKGLSKILLSWATASELNFDYFDIEKSSDGKAFHSIARVSGHGTTNERKDYAFDDEKPYIGKNYYRLKSVDFDGYTEYFNVVLVDFDGSKGFSISPNPSDGLTFTAETNFIPQSHAYIVIYSTLGSEIGRFEVFGNKSQLTMPVKLAAGVYYARYISRDFTSTNRVLVK